MVGKGEDVQAKKWGRSSTLHGRTNHEFRTGNRWNLVTSPAIGSPTNRQMQSRNEGKGKETRKQEGKPKPGCNVGGGGKGGGRMGEKIGNSSGEAKEICGNLFHGARGDETVR